MEKHPLIRTIYLYLFAIVGLALLVTGCVRFIDMGLKVFIFKQADAPQRLQQQFNCLSYAPISVVRIQSESDQPSSSNVLTPDEQTALKDFLNRYKECQEEGVKIDYVSSERQRNASMNLAMILVGLPLYLYHWRVISRETKKREEEKS